MERTGQEAVATAMEWRDGKIMVETAHTKVCKVCERELPETKFAITKGGVRMNTCNECKTAKRLENNRLKMGGGTAERCKPFYDNDFDGKQPVEVIQLMSRAKKWLESRGYEITLRGKVTITKEVKF